MQETPRVGLVLIRADWFDCGESQTIKDLIEADTQELTSRLSRYFTLPGTWVIHSTETLRFCQEGLRNTALDMVLLVFQTWAEDRHLVSLLPAIGSHPLVLWCYLPWQRLPRPASFAEVLRGSGPVGAFSALGSLRNQDIPFLFVHGAPSDPRLIQDLRVAGKAARVRERLRTARFGLIPNQSERIESIFVDEERLKAEIGPVVQHISAGEVKQAVDCVPEAKVTAYLAALRARFPIEDVSDATLASAARTALGLRQLAVDHRLDVLAVDDTAVELYRDLNTRPALYPDLLDPLDALFQPEGDLGAATANYILHHLTGSPTMFLELWFWDEAKNQIIGGHGGMQNPAMGEPDQICITHDFDLCHPIHQTGDNTEGAHFQMIAHPGRVTLFQLRATPKGWQAVAASGICLEGLPWVEAYPHAIVRLDAPIDRFLGHIADVGVTQHWIMAYGSALNELDTFCKMQGIPLELVTY